VARRLEEPGDSQGLEQRDRGGGLQLQGGEEFEHAHDSIRTEHVREA
jgi:hypothetical protein